jgi:hypothetical protein
VNSAITRANTAMSKYMSILPRRVPLSAPSESGSNKTDVTGTRLALATLPNASGTTALLDRLRWSNLRSSPEAASDARRETSATAFLIGTSTSKPRPYLMLLRSNGSGGIHRFWHRSCSAQAIENSARTTPRIYARPATSIWQLKEWRLGYSMLGLSTASHHAPFSMVSNLMGGGMSIVTDDARCPLIATKQPLVDQR